MADISLLLDTDALIESFRGSPQAATWLGGHGKSVIGIPVIVWMELLQGARDRMEQEQIEQRLAILPVEHICTDDSRHAASRFAAYRLSHGIGMLDCLIAAAALRTAVPNLSHFAPIHGIDARRPYARTATWRAK
ncbi:MAG: PIN domain-containing protein [Deltaproteobacteria bacterium]|nr:PIN domain-containing protein [Deltaproteobacteria bacterium]